MVGFIQIHETTPNSMLREKPLVDSISLMEHAACPIGIYVQDQVEFMTLRMFNSNRVALRDRDWKDIFRKSNTDNTR